MTLAERFSGKYDVSSEGCWVWNRSRDVTGCGRFQYEGRMALAHVASYRMHIGSVPARHDVRQTCDVRACVNPAHLVPRLQVRNVHTYRAPIKSTPPAPISHLGRVIRCLPLVNGMTSRQVFDAAFEPHESYECCKAMLRVARARDYITKTHKGWRTYLYALTDKGAEVQRAISPQR